MQIAWVAEGRANLRALTLDSGACVADALTAFERELPGTLENPGDCAVGVFGLVAPRTQILQDGDRLEIYRVLPNDPKIARRDRARRAARRR